MSSCFLVFFLFMKIYSNNFLYNILYKYVLFVYKYAFSKISIEGRQNIPTDGAIIFAPNHTNAFMDAFSVLKVAQKPVVFVARADVFRNPIVAKIFNFFKIMPIMRMRDGRENLKKNDKIMHDAVQVLRNGVPFGIFCEGTHRMKHSILPLVKGIFRIALQADDSLAGEMPVYIVPIGIEYGSYTRYRSTISIQIGEAFNVSDFNKLHHDKTQPELMMLMRSELTKRISSLYHCVADDENYEATLDLCYIRNRNTLKQLNLSSTPYNIMQANRHIVLELQQLQQKDLQQYQQLILKAKQFASLRRELNISDETLYKTPSHKLNISRLLGLIITFPYFVFSAIIDFPVSLLTWLLFTFIIEDGAMKNSLRMLIIMLLYPIIFFVLALILLQYFPWYIALLILLIATPANIFVHKYAKVIRLIKSDFKYLKSSKLQQLKSLLI